MKCIVQCDGLYGKEIDEFENISFRKYYYIDVKLCTLDFIYSNKNFQVICVEMRH